MQKLVYRRSSGMESASHSCVSTTPNTPMAQTELSEEELLQRVARKDSRAFDQLYEALAPRLFGMMRQMLNDDRVAEEVLTEGFVHVWEQASSYDESRCKAFVWAVTVFRQKAIERMRALGRRNRRVDAQSLEQVTFPADATSPDSEAVGTALAAVPKEDRRLIECAFLKGLTHHVMSEALGQTPEATKAGVRRGMMHLRDSLKKGGL